MKFVIAARDIASANILKPLIPLLVRNGHSVYLGAEGKALQWFDEAGISIDSRGTENSQMHPFEFDADKILEREKPDAVIAGLGWPIYTERLLAQAANVRNIPLVLLEDFWGSTRVRAQAIPNLLLVVDEYAEELGRRSFPGIRIAVVGDAAALLPPLSEEPAFAEIRQKYDTVVTFFGSGPGDTEEMTELLIPSLLKTKSNWCLIPRFHPKIIKVPSPHGVSYGEVWNKLLLPIAERVVSPVVKSSEVVVMQSDIVVSNFSKLLATSALAGKVSVSLCTPRGIAIMREETGFDDVPHVKMGCVHQISAATDLSALKPIDPQHIAAKIKPYNPEAALKAIDGLF